MISQIRRETACYSTSERNSGLLCFWKYIYWDEIGDYLSMSQFSVAGILSSKLSVFNVSSSGSKTETVYYLVCSTSLGFFNIFILKLLKKAAVISCGLWSLYSNKTNFKEQFCYSVMDGFIEKLVLFRCLDFTLVFFLLQKKKGFLSWNKIIYKYGRSQMFKYM